VRHPGLFEQRVASREAAGVDSKKKTFKYAEQLKPEIAKERSDWRERQAEVDVNHAYFLDESAAKTNMTRLYGRGPKGQRVYDHTSDGRWHTYTMLGTLTLRGAGPMLTFSGGVNVPTLEAYVEQLLAPVLKPGDVVYMDNLAAHKHPDIAAAISRAGARLVLIPRYSPDFNPIEMMWSKIKAYLRKVKARTEADLIAAIGAALETITATDAANWFRHCGYSNPFTQ
jgi:transposase